MDKTAALDEFLKSLRIAINNASVYSHEHTVFLRCLQDLKKKTDTLLELFGPVDIGITPVSLLLADKYWEKAKLYIETAQFFHCRKIKNIHIKPGIAVEDLGFFLSVVSMPPASIIKNGGAVNLLRQKGVSSVAIEELDYSQLIKGESKGHKDLWGYLLKNAVEQKDDGQINALSDNFRSMMGKLKMKDFSQDKELKEGVLNFLDYLREKEDDKFHKCSKDLLQLFLKSAPAESEEDAGKLKDFFHNMSTKDMSDALWDEVVNDENFNPTSLSVFSRFIDNKKAENIGDDISKRIEGSEGLKNDLHLRRKINDLFSTPISPFISQIYKRVTAVLDKTSKIPASVNLDSGILRANYYATLLNLLATEIKAEKIAILVAKLIDEWEGIIFRNDSLYLAKLFEVLEKKKKEGLSFDKSFQDVYTHIVSLLEREMLKGKSTFNFEFILDYIDSSFIGIEPYLDRIFAENQPGAAMIKALFKFFSGDLSEFYKRLKERCHDFAFIEKIIDSLKTIEFDNAIIVLKFIFTYSNDFMKAQVLKFMKRMDKIDEPFLFSILNGNNIYLKKIAFSVMVKNSTNRQQILKAFFSVPNKFGVNNRLIEEHIDVVVEERIFEAKEYLMQLSKGFSLFKIGLRKKARQALEKLNG